MCLTDEIKSLFKAAKRLRRGKRRLSTLAKLDLISIRKKGKRSGHPQTGKLITLEDLLK
jgi:hypothetical protein